MYTEEGIKHIGAPAIKATFREFEQLNKGASPDKNYNTLSTEDYKQAIHVVNFIREK